jgi:phosphoglycolate phosphatase
VSGYDTVLFDSDGVLVKPPANETQIEATQAAFQEVDIEETDQQHLIEIVDGVTVDRLHEICTAYDLDPDAFWEARERHDEQSQLDTFEGGSRNRYEDVTAISDLSQSCGVVSNNHHSTIEFVLDFFELHRLFDTYYGREKTIESLDLKKPNPQYLERALADHSAESALYVGDSESDVVAANQAGMDSVFVRREHCRDVELTATPTYEVNDLYDVATIVEE